MGLEQITYNIRHFRPSIIDEARSLGLLKREPEDLSAKISIFHEFFDGTYVYRDALWKLVHLPLDVIQRRMERANDQEEKLRQTFSRGSAHFLMTLKVLLLSVPSEGLSERLDAIIAHKNLFLKFVLPGTHKKDLFNILSYSTACDILETLLKIPADELKAKALIMNKVLACDEGGFNYNLLDVDECRYYIELVNKLLDLTPEQLEAFDKATPLSETFKDKLTRLNTFMEMLKEGAAPEK